MIYNLTIYLVAILASFVLSWLAVPQIIKLANKLGAVDNPGVASRKIHQKSTPLLGGVSIFIASFLVLFCFRWFGLANFAKIPDLFLAGVFLAGLLIMIGGFLDDKYSLKPWQQIIWPVLAAIVVLAVGIKISYITNPVGGPKNTIIYLTPLVSLPLSFLWLMGMMYTTKFLDGLDGLVAGVASIASLIIFLLSLDWDVPMSATGLWSLMILGAALGFLVFNWHPAKVFLGEGGSVFIGFILAVLSIISGSKITTTLLVLGIPALDVLLVIIQRLIKRESPFSHADRKHLHFRLLDVGLKQPEAVLVLYLISLAFGSLAIINHSLGKLLSLILLAALALILAIGLAFITSKNVSKNSA